MDVLIAHWHQILFVVGIIVVAMSLESEVKNLRKDVDQIQKRDTYVETVKLRAEMDVQNKQVSALWDFCNKLREKFNGHSRLL